MWASVGTLFGWCAAGQEDTAGRFQIEPPCLVLHRKESKVTTPFYSQASHPVPSATLRLNNI